MPLRTKTKAQKALAGRAAPNPHPHVDLEDYEVTAYPDNVVGLQQRATGYGILLSIYSANRLGRALLNMAYVASVEARAASAPKTRRPSRRGGTK